MMGTVQIKRYMIATVARHLVREISKIRPYTDTKQCRVGKGYVPKQEAWEHRVESLNSTPISPHWTKK